MVLCSLFFTSNLLRTVLKPMTLMQIRFLSFWAVRLKPYIRELKQRRRQRQRKRHLDTEFISFMLLRDYVNSFNFYRNGELLRNEIGRGGVQVKRQNENFTVVCSRSPQNLEFGHFTLLFCRGRQRNVPKFITHVQGDCLSSLNLLFCGVVVAVVVIISNQTAPNIMLPAVHIVYQDRRDVLSGLHAHFPTLHSQISKPDSTPFPH